MSYDEEDRIPDEMSVEDRLDAHIKFVKDKDLKKEYRNMKKVVKENAKSKYDDKDIEYVVDEDVIPPKLW